MNDIIKCLQFDIIPLQVHRNENLDIKDNITISNLQFNIEHLDESKYFPLISNQQKIMHLMLKDME